MKCLIQCKHIQTYDQITRVEAVFSRPALLAKSSASTNNGVEPTQAEEATLHLIWLFTLIYGILRKVIPRSNQIALYVGWGFVRNLDAGLQETFRHVPPRRYRGWFRTEKACSGARLHLHEKGPAID